MPGIVRMSSDNGITWHTLGDYIQMDQPLPSRGNEILAEWGREPLEPQELWSPREPTRTNYIKAELNYIFYNTNPKENNGMTLSIHHRVMNAVLVANALPGTIDLYSIPDNDTVAKIRETVTKVHAQMGEIIKTLTVNQISNGIYVRPEAGGIVWSDGSEHDSMRVTFQSLTFNEAESKERIANLAPAWVELDWSAFNMRATIRATDEAGALRKKVIPAIVTELNLNSWQRVNPAQNISRDIAGDHLDMNAMHRLESLATKVSENYIRTLRAMFKTAAEVPEAPKKDTLPQFEAFMKARRESMETDELNILKMPVLPHGTLTDVTWGIEVEAAGARGVDQPKGGWDRKGDSSLRSAYSDGGTRYVDPDDCYYADRHEEFVNNDAYDPNEFIDNPDYDEAEAIAAEEAGEDYDEPEQIENPEYDDNEQIDNPDYLDSYDCEECGEVYTDEDDEYGDTAEFVSPILRSFHSQGLEGLVAALAEEPQNDSAGVHVHVGAKQLTPRQIGSLVLGYQLIEPLIEASYQRDTREYCKIRTEFELLKVMKTAKTATKLKVADRYSDSERTDGSVLHHGDRYVALNLNSLNSHGTVEFRAMGPVYDYEFLIRWASFVREMVNAAAGGAGPKDWMGVHTWDDLMALFAKFGIEYPKAKLAELEKAHTMGTVEVRALQNVEI